MLAGGCYFATETARILGGAGGALLAAEQGGRADRRAAADRGDRVSWQVGSFALLALALGAGFAWYERSAADARIIAMVGHAGRPRRARAGSPSPPLPNVKPTTDIVLIAGFALGGAPRASWSARWPG